MTIMNDEFDLPSITLESLVDAKYDSKNPDIYILLTNTTTTFSSIAKMVTKQPYNHVSMILSKEPDKIYSYNISTPEKPLGGGFVVEGLDDLMGATYSLYKITVSKEAYSKANDFIKKVSSTDKGYSLKGLVNSAFNADIFETDPEAFICSEFVVSMLDNAGVLIKDKSFNRSRIKPYDIVKTKMLQFVKRGKITKKTTLS